MERMGQARKFEPEKRRYIFWQSVPLVLGALIASPIIYIVTGSINWVFIATLIIGYPIVVATLGIGFLDLFSIVIGEGYISGRAAVGLGRTKLALERIDKQRTRRRTLFQRLFGYMYIYSLDGQGIAFYERQFEPADVDAILGLIGLELSREGREHSK